MYFKWLQLAIAKFVDPRDWSQTKMNHQIQDIVAIDLDAITMVLPAISAAVELIGDDAYMFIDSCNHQT